MENEKLLTIFWEIFRFGVFSSFFSGLLHIAILVLLLNFEWMDLHNAFIGSFWSFPLLAVVFAFLYLLDKTRIIHLGWNNTRFCLFEVSVLFIMVTFLNHLVDYGLRLADDDLAGTYFSTISAAVIAVYLLYRFFFKGRELSKSLLKSLGNLGFINSNFVIFFSVFLFSSIVLQKALIGSIDPGVLISDLSGVRHNVALGKKNIVLISIDALRADHMSVYGFSKNTTPWLLSLANSSVVFDNAYSCASWTFASHACIFTGRYSYQTGAGYYETSGPSSKDAGGVLRNDELTIPEIMKKAGYVTVGSVANFHLIGKKGFSQGFDYYYDDLPREESTFPWMKNHNYTYKTSSETNSEIFNWLDSHVDSRFFMFVHYMDVHDPYNLGLNIVDDFSDNDSAGLFDNAYLEKLHNDFYTKHSSTDPEYIEHLSYLYDSEINELDSHIKDLFLKFEKLGLLNDTIFIITADHGEEFLEHDGVRHKRTVFNEVTHVPLIVYSPSDFAPSRIEGSVENMDVFSTIVDLAGVDPNNLDSNGLIYSESLVPLLSDSGSYGKQFVYSDNYNPDHQGSKKLLMIRSVIKDNWKLIVSDPKSEVESFYLFNLENDPSEKINLYNTSTEKKNELNNLIELRILNK